MNSKEHQHQAANANSNTEGHFQPSRNLFHHLTMYGRHFSEHTS